MNHTKTLLKDAVNKPTLPVVTRNSPKLAIGLVKFLLGLHSNNKELLKYALAEGFHFHSLELFKVYEDGKETYSKLFKSKRS